MVSILLSVLPLAIAVIVVLVIVLTIVKKVNQTVASVSSVVVPFMDAVKEADKQQMVTPKTLSGTEPIYVPKIEKDFPEMNADVAKSYIKNFLPQYFQVMNTGNTNIIKDDCSRQFIERLNVLCASTSKTTFEQVKVHRVVISNYRRDDAEATITFEAAVQYVSSRNNRLTQDKYTIQYVYYLDYGQDGENVSLRCKHCGAPISSVGQKVCPYCDSAIEAAIARTWKITDVKCNAY